MAWTVDGLRGSDSGGASGAPSGSGAFSTGLRDLRHERLQREPRVGDDRLAHRRARRLVGVAGDLDERAALGQQRPRDVGVVREHRAPDHEHQVVVGEHLADRPDGRRQRATEARMSLREADPPSPGGRGGPHRQPLALRQGDRRIPCAGRVDIRAHHEGGVRSGVQALGERPDRLGVRPGPANHRALDRVFGIAVVDLLPPVVHRDRHEDGPTRWKRREVRGPAERQRHVGGARGLVAPLDEGMGQPGRVPVGQVGLQRDHGPHLLAGGDHEWGLVGLRVEDRAHRVAHPGSRVEVHQRRAAGRLRVPVGHSRPPRPPAARART